MSTETIHVGLIGTGKIGSLHAENLMQRTRGATVVAVMDIDHERANAVAAACDGARVYADAGDLIADPAVDAILIASTDRTHADFAIACIEEDKPVLCEKPLATTVADAERVLRAELGGGRRLVQVGFMC